MDQRALYSMLADITVIISLLISAGLSVAVIVAQWRIFRKAGEPGWACLVPFYNSYILFKIVYGQGWKFLLLFIPLLNYVMAIAVSVRLAQAFGLSTLHQVLMVFISPVEYLIIAFSDAQYRGYIDSFL